MSELVPDSQVLRFGAFEAELRLGELRKSGVRIKLQDQPFQVLSILLEQRGKLVTREELQKRLWPADTFVDFEHGLNTAITKLRQALADDADNPRFIETVPRRGYRFIAPVTASENGGSSGPQLQAASASPRQMEGLSQLSGDTAQSVADSVQLARRSARPLLWLGGLVLLGGLVGTLWFAFLRPASHPRWSEVRIAPLNGLPRESDAAFSPDGSRVAFVWAGEKNDNLDIYVSQIGTEARLRLTSFPGANVAPVWSPDGQYIAFMRFSKNEQDDGIYIISSLGGTERKVYSLTRTRSRKEIDWSPDGKYLAFGERNSPSEASSIFLLSLDNLGKHQLTFAPSGILGDSDPAFSPDGKNVAFLRDALDTQEAYIVPVEGGTPRQVTFDQRSIQGLSWSADGKEIVYSSNRRGSYSLWRIPVPGGVAERLPIGGGTWAMRPTVARRGNRLAYTSVNYSSAIWRAELSPSGSSPVHQEKLISSTELEEGPQFSPDGKRIAFQSTRTGSYEIWRCDRDGSNLLQLTHFSGSLTGTPRWSPDSRQIAFDSRPEGHSQVFVIDAEGSGQPRQVTSGTAEHAVPSWSTDGKSIYYASNENGTWQIWKVPVQGGSGVQLTKQGGFAPLPSLDGSYIFYAKGRDLAGIWRVPVEGGEEDKVLDDPPGGGWGYFAVTEKGIYYGSAPNGTNPGIYLYNFATHTATKVMPVDKEPSTGAPGLSASPDGRSLLCVFLDQPTVYVVLVENFR